MNLKFRSSAFLGVSMIGLLMTGAASAETTFHNPNNLPAVQQRADVAHCREVVGNAQERQLGRSNLRRSTSRPSTGQQEVSGIVIEDLPIPEQERIIVDGPDTRNRRDRENIAIRNARVRGGNGGGEHGIIIIGNHPADTDPAFVACMTRRGYTQ